MIWAIEVFFYFLFSHFFTNSWVSRDDLNQINKFNLLKRRRRKRRRKRNRKRKRRSRRSEEKKKK
jgi:hypothetical protein